MYCTCAWCDHGRTLRDIFRIIMQSSATEKVALLVTVCWKGAQWHRTVSSLRNLTLTIDRSVFAPRSQPQNPIEEIRNAHTVYTAWPAWGAVRWINRPSVGRTNLRLTIKLLCKPLNKLRESWLINCMRCANSMEVTQGLLWILLHTAQTLQLFIHKRLTN